MKRVVVWGICIALLAGCASLGGRSSTNATGSGAPRLYTDCASALVVGLRWDPPVGSESERDPIRYTITRDGSLLGSTSETNFVDTTVTASTAGDAPSADGLSLWLTYPSDGKAPAGALFPPEGTMLDSFNLVSARLILATTPDAQTGRPGLGSPHDLTSSGGISQIGRSFLDRRKLGPLIFAPLPKQ